MNFYLNDIKSKEYKYSKTNPGPYEIAAKNGVSALSDAQLLGVILRTGTVGEDAVALSERIFSDCCRMKGLNGLHQVTMQELMKIKGIGNVKAVQLLCVAELSKRMVKQQAGDRPFFGSPKAIASYYMQDMAHLDKEIVVLVCLDARCRLIKDLIISKGSVDCAMISTRDIFSESLRHGAVSFVILHNHPSGDPTPSLKDIEVTETITKGAHILGINLADHIVIGNNKYLSFREEKLLR